LLAYAVPTLMRLNLTENPLLIVGRQYKDALRDLFLAEVHHGNGCAYLGEVEQLLPFIPPARVRDVILFDISSDFPPPLNAFHGVPREERSAVPENERRPAFLIVDEAAEYFDSNISDLLTTARKYRVGCILAHQYLEQCTPGLRSALAANTAIKIASTRNTSDAKAMASDLRTTPEFILSQPSLSFACDIEGATPNAVAIKVPYGEMEGRPRLSDMDFRELVAANRDKVSMKFLPPPLPPAPPPRHEVPQEPDQRKHAERPAEPPSADFEPAVPSQPGVAEPSSAAYAPDIDDIRALIRVAERAKQFLHQAGIENAPGPQIAPVARQLVGPRKKRRRPKKKKFKPIVD
jgi:hypothetical protein